MYGRVTEVCALRETQLSYNGAAKCVELQLMRTKTRSRGENISHYFFTSYHGLVALTMQLAPTCC